MSSYGVELILDLHDCNVTKFNRKDIQLYCERSCTLMHVSAEDLHFWDDYHTPEEHRQTDPRTKGTTAIQFLLTSNITVHTLDLLSTIFINIFSCKDYDAGLLKGFAVTFWEAKECKSTLIERGVL